MDEVKVGNVQVDAAAWLAAYSSSTLLDVFGPAPATKIAYAWLSQDLGRLELSAGAFFGPEM